MADLQLMEAPAPANGGGAGEEVATGAGAKRQRRPSVRLGDIGGPAGAAGAASDPQIRRNKQGRISPHPLHPDPSSHGEPSMAPGGVLMGKIPLRKLPEHRNLHLSEETAGPRRGSGNASERKSSGGGPRGRRVRTNWASRFEGTDGRDFRSSEDDAAEEAFRVYDEEDDDSGSPQKEDSRVRVSDGREGTAAAAASEEMDPDVALGSDFGLWNSRRLRSLGDGSVRAWLNGLGLGRYVPVFQIHEVDDEVLPFLTLEDLKEMGITAVGSRRKIYFAIQKLGKRCS